MTEICVAVRQARRIQLERFHEQLPLIDEGRDPWLLLSEGRPDGPVASPEGRASAALLAEQHTSRRGEAVSRRAHNAEIAGSNPAGAIPTQKEQG